MTQARPRQTLKVQLTSMRPPDTLPQGSEDIALVLYPGIQSEVVMQLENLGDRPLAWQSDLKGALPTGCQFFQQQDGDTDTTTLLPRQKVFISLSFHVPADFFENQFALQRDPSLTLNYSLHLYVYTEEEGDRDRELVALCPLTLYVRPNGVYINFLPAIFRQADFTNRFLSIFEKTFAPTLQTLDLLWAYLDPLTAPEALLPFLAHWVAWELDNRWSLEQQRRLLRYAVTLYRWHGTQKGLLLYLHLYTGFPLDENLPEAERHISILESATESFVLGSAPLGAAAALGGGRPYHFTVRLRPRQSDPIDETLIREIIERYKPAFCTYNLEITPLPDASNE